MFVFCCRLFGFIARVPSVSGASFFCYIFECDASGEPVRNHAVHLTYAVVRYKQCKDSRSFAFRHFTSLTVDFIRVAART